MKRVATETEHAQRRGVLDAFRGLKIAFSAAYPRFCVAVRCGVLLVLIALPIVTGATCFFYRDLLVIVADKWQVDQRVKTADAVFVPGGGATSRPYVAARLFHRGVVSRVLISDVQRTPSDRAGITVPEVRRTLKLLDVLGVSRDAIEIIGEQVSSTYEETIAIRDWMMENNSHRIIVPTDGFHSRRLQWIMNKYASGADREIFVWADVNGYFRIDSWWKNEYGVVAFQNEVLKYLVYRLRY
jgi:uncharacterized SAM-binding protein YcdF (DUF218 family)